jgi:hypothetical protein
MQPACRPVIANPQGEAIQRPRMDCFTLRDDVRDNLNYPVFLSVTPACRKSRIQDTDMLHKLRSAGQISEIMSTLPGILNLNS